MFFSVVICFCCYFSFHASLLYEHKSNRVIEPHFTSQGWIYNCTGLELKRRIFQDLDNPTQIIFSSYSFVRVQLAKLWPMPLVKLILFADSEWNSHSLHWCWKKTHHKIKGIVHPKLRFHPFSTLLTEGLVTFSFWSSTDWSTPRCKNNRRNT